jgi:hypothetical protein
VSQEDFPTEPYIITLGVVIESEVRAQSLEEAHRFAVATMQTVRQDHPATYLLRVLKKSLWTPLGNAVNEPSPPPRGGPPGGTPGTPTIKSDPPVDAVAA